MYRGCPLQEGNRWQAYDVNQHNMKTTFGGLQVIIKIIAFLLFIAGSVLVILGGYEFGHAVTLISDAPTASAIAVDIIRAVDLFLIAIVLFVFSLGILILFNNKTETALPANLPQWLKVKNFMELKIILWEAILTTLVISYLAGMAKIKIAGGQPDITSLLVPGAILLIALSLYFLKRGEEH